VPASTRLRFVELIRAPGVRALACLAAAATIVAATIVAAAIVAAAIVGATVIAAPLSGAQPATSAAPASGAPAAGVPATGAPADASPAETLRACAGKLQRAARGLDTLAARCPDLKPALAALRYSEALPSGWESELTPGQIEDLAALASRYRGEPPSAAPDVGAVRGILAGLAKESATAPKSWWELLSDWVRSLFAGDDKHDVSWIDRLMTKLSSASGVLTVLTYVLVGLVIGGAFAYLVMEMRSSGLFARASSSKSAGGERLAGEGPAEDQLARAPIFDQPALLLGLLVRRLRRSGRLSAERHLTHRELTRAAALDDPGQRGRLGRLTQVAEELLYGGRPPSVELVHQAIEEGRELLRELDAPREIAP
jgi:hypothetical protein